MSESTVASGKRLECNLIMQGGITSGVVYPPAVLRLKERYDFSAIGGASAGALAAALTAAAQLGKDRKDEEGKDGFARLEDVSNELGKDDKLVSLFRATASTRPLLEVFLAALKGAHRSDGKTSYWHGALAVLLALIRHLPVAMLTGAAGAGGFSLLILWLAGAPIGPRPITLSTLVGILGAFVGAAVRLAWLLLRGVPGNRFGITSGLSTDPDHPALTDWMTGKLSLLADPAAPDRVLTFGDLQTAGITLQVLTTNLSEQRPYAVPFEDNRFLFNEREMRSYFPASVVDHMVKHAYRSPRVTPKAGFHFLPETRDLPVVFAARISLSFPVLISALPLYTLDIRQPTADPLINWMSDGGICSNFPIHFFDHLLPSRPTFGICLSPFPEAVTTPIASDLHPDHDPSAQPGGTPPAVFLPRPNRATGAELHKLNGLPAFLGRIVTTALDYRDTLQRGLPGYRESVVQIHLTPEEGGLNLDMSPERVKALQDRGAAAGDRLLSEFQFPAHRWTRLRVLLPRLLKEIEALRDQRATLHVRAMNAGAQAQGAVYPAPSDRWCDDVEDFLNRLIASPGVLDSTHPPKPPHPEAVLRMTPRM